MRRGRAAQTSATSRPAKPAAAPTTAPAATTAATGGAQAAPTTAPAAAQTAPAQAAAKPGAAGGAITFALENDVIDFDPLRSRAFVDRNIHYQIYDSLVRIDPSGKIVPWLAEKWDTSADGKQVTFSLRKDVKYHDGTAVRRRVGQVEHRPLPHDRGLGAQRRAGAGRRASTSSTPSTVRFNLKSPFSPLLALLVDRAGMMVSRKAVEAGGEDFTRKAFKAGTGPFILTEAVKDDHMTLEKNPDWWGKDASGGKLPLPRQDHHPADHQQRRSPDQRQDRRRADHQQRRRQGRQRTSRPTASLTYQEKPGVQLGQPDPQPQAEGFVFNEARYVKAVSMAIDRKEILDKAFFGVGSVGYGPIAPQHFAYDANFKPFEKADIEGAKKLVQEVGKGPLAFEFLVSSGDPATLQQAQLIQAQLREADIDAQITQLEFAQILELQSKKTFKGVTFIGWSGRIDPDANLYDHIYSGRPFNDSSYTNKEVDGLLDEQRATTDEAKRKDALRKAEQIYVVDDPARVWFRFGVAQLLTVKAVQGLEPYPDQIPRFQFASLQR